MAPFPSTRGATLRLPVELDSPAVDQQPYETFVVELLVDEDRAVRRTRVVHVQTGAEERWAGWDGERLLGFVVTNGSVDLVNDG